MKYAAKRTWPDRPKSWEAKGEAETADAFALDFAVEQGLGLGTELVVIEREGEDGEIRFYKVSGTSPYQLAHAEPRVGAASATVGESTTEAIPSDAPTPVNHVTLESLRPFRTMILYMLKVAVIAAAIIYALGMLFRYLRSVL